MAKQAVAAGVDSMAIPTLPWDGLPAEPYSYGANAVTEAYDHGDWLRKRIEEITGISADERKERIAQMNVTQFDPDLAVNRSMALWAKVAEQKRRNFEISSRREHRNLTRELASWLKDQALKN